MRKRLIPLLLGIGILIILWWKTGWTEIRTTIAAMDMFWLTAALALFIPQIVISGIRWAVIVRSHQHLTVRKATKLVLAASAWNIFLPSKLGDLAKGVFLDSTAPGGDIVTGVSLAAFEKYLDLTALACWMLAATLVFPSNDPVILLLSLCGIICVTFFLLLVFSPAAGWISGFKPKDKKNKDLTGKIRSKLAGVGKAILFLRSDPRRLLIITGLSILLWSLHLLQFNLAFVAVHSGFPEQMNDHVGYAVLWSRIPMAIFVGLVPVTIAGIGSRDAAMFYFLKPYTTPGIAVSLGVFATLRYVVVALAGLPFATRFDTLRNR